MRKEELIKMRDYCKKRVACNQCKLFTKCKEIKALPINTNIPTPMLWTDKEIKQLAEVE